MTETLRDVEKEAMRLAQKGFSHHGIAKRLDVTDGTAKKYLNTIEEVKGIEALW